MKQPWSEQPTVAVVGGGLAGLAAACALSTAGFRVTLLERRPYLGGRASSYQHPGTSEVVDNCQHVLLGCCTNLIDFYRRTGVEDRIRWYDRLTFIEPGGRASVIAPSAIPAPLHSAPAFLKAACLSLSDKLAIARAMAALAPLTPRDKGCSFLEWLRRHGQTSQAIERFWKTILISALNEELDHVSVSSAAQVVRESFLKSPLAGHMGVPTVPLSTLYSAAGEYISKHGGEVRLRASVEHFRAQPSQVSVADSQSELAFDYLVLAVPFEAIGRILPDTEVAEPLRRALGQFKTSPITGIHIWFDRQVTDLEHAVLLDRTIQWMFHKSRIQGRNGSGAGSYIELVVSASNSLVEKPRQEIIDLALAEFNEFFPAAKSATVLKATVIKEVHATYAPRPGIDAYRPHVATAWPRVFLAGDWTATGWPATMEGAVRSGYIAAEAVARVAGLKDASFLVPDLPATGFMRLFPS
nr:15-cis-phytoene desaturase [uncultured bacterium]